jgi:hypothetical protein
MTLNSADVIARNGETIYIRIPKELQKSIGTSCSCPSCKGKEGFWDTLAVNVTPASGRPDTTWTVHMPDPSEMRRLGERQLKGTP